MNRLKGMTDEALAMAYIGGNNRAFDLLLERTQTKLFSYILFVVRDRDRANDVFQETFVKVITKLNEGKYTATGKFAAWLMRIAHNVMMDYYRDRHAQNLVDTPQGDEVLAMAKGDMLDSNVENRYVNEQVLSDVKRLMDLLPAPQREVVFMRFYQAMSFKEIAETTGVSINTALGRMRYAVLNMRRMAKQHGVALQLD